MCNDEIDFRKREKTLSDFYNNWVDGGKDINNSEFIELIIEHLNTVDNDMWKAENHGLSDMYSNAHMVSIRLENSYYGSMAEYEILYSDNLIIFYDYRDVYSI